MTITKIEPLDKRRSKVTVNEDFTLALYKGEIRRFHIEEGGELSDEVYQEILDEVLYKRAVERACYILKSSDKTEQEMRRKLTEGCYPREAVDYAIDFLKSHRYIDDENYGKRYAEFNSSRKSRRLIQYELQKKGLPSDVISEILEEQPIDEEAQIYAQITKKYREPKDMTPQERTKMMASLQRKGFSWETVRRVYRKLDCGEDEY